jgi:serine/threonine protein phosphatase PrpC
VITYSSALLLGSENTELGAVAVEALSDDLAIGLSRGRFPKSYSHIDPNEDAAFAATNGSASLIAVADGHNGRDAAEAAIEAIAEAASEVIAAPAVTATKRLLALASGGVRSAVSQLQPPRDQSRTALTLCFTVGNEMATATLGDSGYATATRRRVRTNSGRSRFLASTTDPDSVPVDVVPLPTRGLLIAATDGLFDFTRTSLERRLRDLAETTAGETATGLIELAGRGGAGDHVAVGVIRRH